MVYQIYYGNNRPRQVLFDIEFYTSLDETEPDWNNEKKWYVELHSTSFISGAVDFLSNKLRTKDGMNFDIEEFKKDCYDLEELRGWLWETHNNSLRTIKEVYRDKEEWGKYIKDKIYAFADKYGLNVNED